MSNQNLYISNGTCYSKAGEKLDASFIPCGNDAAGRQTCCGKGDNCLADNSCWGQHGSGYGSSLTYMAGCSDPDYKDKSCPDKKGLDQPWIALTLCDNTDGEWGVCSQEGNPTTLQPGSFCSCTDASKSTVAFKDATSLTSICSLPQNTGESIQFFVGHIPTAPAGGTAPGGSSSGGSPSETGTAGSSPGPSPSGTGTGPGGSSTSSSGGENGSSSDPGGGGSGLSQGAKIGIGVGVGVLGLLIIAAIALLFYRRRKRARSSEAKVDEADDGTMGAMAGDRKLHKDQRASAVSASPRVSEADSQPIAEADGKAARPWSMRSELEDTQVSPSVMKHPDHAAPPAALHAEQMRRNADDLSPVPELPGSEGGHAPVLLAGTTTQGGELPTNEVLLVPVQEAGPVGGPKPIYEEGPGHSPVEAAGQAPAVTQATGLHVAGPEGAHSASEQGPRQEPAHGTEHPQ